VCCKQHMDAMGNYKKHSAGRTSQPRLHFCKMTYQHSAPLLQVHGCHGQLQETQRRQDVTATLACL